MNTFKQFFSITTAFLLAAGLTLSASAEAICLQNNDTVSLNSDMHAQNQQITEKIGEYDCWLIDGQYYTALDDEIYQVINLDELNWEHDTLAAQTSSGSRGSGNEVDLSNGKAYHGSVDISNTNFTTSTFIGYTKTSEKKHIAYSIHTEFLFTNKYSVKIYGYNPVTKEWNITNTTLAFNGFGKTKVLFSGTTGIAPSKMYLTFIKASSTGEQVFNYSFYAIQS